MASLSDTLHVPHLSTNLISVGKITENGHGVVFDKKGAQVIDSNVESVLEAKKENGLYFVEVNKER